MKTNLPPAQNWSTLVQQFRPIYKLHSEEMFYPMHFEDLLYYYMNLVRVDSPGLTQLFGSVTPDAALATATGIAQLKARGITLDAQTISDLQPKTAPGAPFYSYLQLDPKYLLQYSYATMGPYGFLTSAKYTPALKTWYHNGAPNCLLNWLGEGGAPCQGMADVILNGPIPALKEPTTICWVQSHTVAGVRYIDFIYTCYFCYNGSISIVPGQGEHFNDIVTNVVRFKASNFQNPVRYFFAQHGGYAWYEPGQVTTVGSQVVVYLARQSHESYPCAGRFPRLFGAADDITDSGGVTWTPDTEYVNRPQGVDAHGVDTDALRCAINPQSPGSVVLIPADTPGPLWQYVRFRFIQMGGDGMNTDLISQGAPLFTDKWWPGEGPAASSGPISTKAADPSGVGVPDSFFANVAPYLGPDPQPKCPHAVESTAGVSLTPYRRHSEFAGPAPEQSPPPGSMRDLAASTSDVGAPIGGPTFLDWTGDVGRYVLGGVQQFAVPYLRTQLPDPLTIPSPWSYKIPPLGPTISLSDLQITGLRRLQIAPITALDKRTLQLTVSDSSLVGTGSLTAAGITVASVTVVMANVHVNAKVDVLTPLALTSQNPPQWYVPYVGPAPYSITGYTFEQTQTVSHAVINDGNLAVTIGNLTVSIGGAIWWLLPVVSFIIEQLTNLLTHQIAGWIASAGKSSLNGILADIYAGKTRVA